MAKGQTPEAGNATIPQTQAQAQPADAPAASSTQPDNVAPVSADRTSTRAADPAISSSSATATASPQSTTAGAKADGSLPNLGFSALVANTQSAAATSMTPSATSTTAAVPVAGLAVAIAARAQSGSNQFDIRLDPPELGRIDVRLDVDGSGQVTTHMTAERSDTLQLLQSQQPQIEQALQDAGLKTADNGLQFTLRDQSFSGQNNNGSGSQSNTSAQVVIPDADLTPIAATQIYSRAGLGSGIDIRV
jgi:flagellar hook-length control protein FliK